MLLKSEVGERHVLAYTQKNDKIEFTFNGEKRVNASLIRLCVKIKLASY